MILGDENLNPVLLIIEDIPLKGHVMTFSKYLKIGAAILVVNPAFEGYFNSMPLLKCKGIIPVSNNITITKAIQISNIFDVKLILVKFSDKDFKVKHLSLCMETCTGPCDCCYRVNYYCMKIKYTINIALVFVFIFKKENLI